tara:strand:+ start:964 stop:1641 length:678 start_codon:yes stop_codon:yes gene_type:complete
MPNHCYTRISISNPTKKQEEILKQIKLDGGLCRYYKPFPKELDGIVNGNTTINGKSVRYWRDVDGKNVAIPEKELTKLKEKYGATNWYDWCLNNWGTKWGCYDFGIDDDVIMFTSAWSPIGETIIQMFAKDFPSFHYEYEEETGWGAELDYEEGECIFFSQYDEPQWDEVDEIETNDYTICITKLLEDHPHYENGVGYYADYSNDFLGKTLEEARKKFNHLELVK